MKDVEELPILMILFYFFLVLVQSVLLRCYGKEYHLFCLPKLGTVDEMRDIRDQFTGNKSLL